MSGMSGVRGCGLTTCIGRRCINRFVVMGHGVAPKNQIDFLNGKIGSGITGQIQGRPHFGSCSNLDYPVHFTVHQCINPVSGARCKCVR